MQQISYTNIPNIKINRYIIDLILPKCNIVFGKSFSSTYLQLLLNTNNEKTSLLWKRNKCWLAVEKIANNINCNIRTVYSDLKNMQNIGLLEKSYHGKLYMFELKNNKFIDYENINKFNIEIEKKLLTLIDLNKKDNIKKKFLDINKYFNNRIVDYEFYNLIELRNSLILSEKIQHGSSLMFLKFFASQYLQSNISEIEIKSLSEKQRSFQLGCSQSTISRYLKSFKSCDFISMIRNNEKKPNTVIINKEMLNMNEKLEIVKQKFICPVCNREIDSLKKLNSHINRCKDELHSMFKELQVENNAFELESINSLYACNKDKFDSIKNEKDEAKNKINKLSHELVKYYYGLTNTKCPSWAKEINLIKSHLNHDLQPDEIMEVMRYMAKRAYQDLRFFNNSINEALIIRQCKIDIKNEGTDAFLIKMYYKGMNQSINDRLMLQGIKKINELKVNGYEYSQIKTIIEYMVAKKCPSFNFIVNMANEALAKSKDKKDMAKAYTTSELVQIALDGVLEYGIIMMKDCNYDMAKKEIIFRLKEDICNGKVELSRVNKTYHKFAIELAKEIYRRNMYNNTYTPQQWARKIQLNEVNFDYANI